ncbi:DUF6507 family protein [Streptomyces sp. NBC_01217]|uniref:DUF6507 family protein n=1 Tax=Streptomyces sp. NBC_01217 TaxID=2903779 RepID=UPI002E10385A|nr:DUF6507 family protein [Streptomyces sp. NBC_01217]
MVAWDIRPQGVQGQLKVTGTHAGDLEKALTALMATMSEAAQAAGTAVPGSQAATPVQGPVAPGRAPLSRKAVGPVAAALGEYLEERQKDLKAMAERIEAAILGAVEATNAYCEGDLEAAKHAQDAAKSVRLDLLKDAGEQR